MSTAASRVLCFVAGVISTVLIYSIAPLDSSRSQQKAPAAAVMNEKYATTSAPQPEPLKQKQRLTLQNSFFCGGECFRDHPLRIAIVGDSISYGNGTHDDPPRFVTLSGTWPQDVFRDVRVRADSCPDAFVDTRNFAVERTSVACDFNNIAQFEKYKRSVAWKPHVVILALGSNDAHNSACCPCNVGDGAEHSWRGGNCSRCLEKDLLCNGPFPAEKFISRYSSMIADFHGAGAKQIILVTPPPQQSTNWTRSHFFQPELVTASIVPLIKQIAKNDPRVTGLVDFHGAISKLPQAQRQNIMFSDGLHLQGIHGHRFAAHVFQRAVCAT